MRKTVKACILAAGIALAAPPGSLAAGNAPAMSFTTQILSEDRALEAARAFNSRLGAEGGTGSLPSFRAALANMPDEHQAGLGGGSKQILLGMLLIVLAASGTIAGVMWRDLARQTEAIE